MTMMGSLRVSRRVSMCMLKAGANAPATASKHCYSGRNIYNNNMGAHRHYTQTQQPPKGIRQGTLFAILACTGLGVTIYSLLEYYSAFNQWPPSLRADLRLAVKAQRGRDYNRAEEHWRRVIDRAEQLPESEFESEGGLGVSKPLVVTGLHISLAHMLEVVGRSEGGGSGKAGERISDAHRLLSTALSYLLRQQHKEDAPPAETHRAIALAVKLGDMAYTMRSTSAQHYYEWALDEMFRVSRVEKARKENESERDGEKALEKQPDNTHAHSLMTHQLDLPKWVAVSDLGGCLERLAAIYGESGHAEMAIPLYMQAITLLLPPPTFRLHQPSTSDTCRAALLMTNLASVLTAHPSSKNLDNALKWADKAVDLVTHADSAHSDKICNHTLAVGLFNVGVLNEMLNHPSTALDNYNRASEHSDKYGLVAAKLQSKEASRRVRSDLRN
ncbi:hypothetical protein J056_003709 [Wallemia ichthyophaga EXF-994]|uniref:TPR repeat-containing protein P27G11.02 n=1 Tax=Wallemia ichthyophaga (strain EXF-994 / CBS 113033) TaxID=1299270 RepID=R9AIK5_WALI9|nr:uncharacterized protein J056_003709 [Wallemia ichthyophaga EXF-994]EOR02033.1 hypothetical protein J056_003709 [Wallemia ichthyophaga EXF-994]TIA83697.1 hypothetical protein E3P98_00610 [Wallemia ichthyophaga]TIB36864.1 hypothetical protein E3P84_00645 [Wallemia ichthyophaga]TIB43324.1 hypothetical protein E3P83_00781 [Wallemia ichthyophaga]